MKAGEPRVSDVVEDVIPKTRWRISDSADHRTLNDSLGLIRLAFKLGSKVRLVGSDVEAVVLVASVTTRGIIYQCAWWNDKSRTECWFEEFELEALP